KASFPSNTSGAQSANTLKRRASMGQQKNHKEVSASLERSMGLGLEKHQ
ncbi:hypothetical protein KFL_010450010, partial [Klebsormidium nitens]